MNGGVICVSVSFFGGDIANIPFMTRLYLSQLVQDFYYQQKWLTCPTVDGQNPAPPVMSEILQKTNMNYLPGRNSCYGISVMHYLLPG